MLMLSFDNKKRVTDILTPCLSFVSLSLYLYFCENMCHKKLNLICLPLIIALKTESK